MMKKPDKFDFWYAINNTEIIAMPTRQLETFGSTILNYHVISEMMDSISQVKVREGRIQSYRPQILVPGSSSYQNAVLEGFGEEAERYVDWMRDHKMDLHILRYGFKIKKEEFSEHVLTDNLATVAERVQSEIKGRNDPFSAVVLGVDKPWEVCLLKLMMEVIRQSIPSNIQDLQRRNMFGDTDGIPNVIHREIEDGFLAAARNPAYIKRLAEKLERYGVLEKYQDRFFSLVRENAEK